jgi:acetyl-CoA synthetase
MAESHDAASGFVWYPSDGFKRDSNWAALVAAENLADYPMLARKAAQDPEWFWDALIRFLGVQFVKPYSRVLDQSNGIEWPGWCIGATGNMTLSLLDRHLAAGRGEHDAIVWEGEEGTQSRLTYRQLAIEVNRFASGLAALGFKSGDAVGIYLPMVSEVAVAYLALARLGCIILPLFSGFGAAAITVRLNDAEAVAVITADGSLRRGKPIDMKGVLDEAIKGVPTIRHVVVARRCADADRPRRVVERSRRTRPRRFRGNRTAGRASLDDRLYLRNNRAAEGYSAYPLRHHRQDRRRLPPVL